MLLQLRFDQDNMLTDRPMVDVITSLDHMLEGARARADASAGLGSASLQQLVLIIADGRCVAEAAQSCGWWQRAAQRALTNKAAEEALRAIKRNLGGLFGK